MSNAAPINAVVAAADFPKQNNPLYETGAAATNIISLTNPAIIKRTADAGFVCVLCTVVPTIDNGGVVMNKNGGVTVRFAMKKGMRWGDGYPVDAQDVIFSLNVMSSLPDGNQYKNYRNRIENINVETDKDGIANVILTFPVSGTLASILPLFPLIPAHLEQERFTADPANYVTNSAYTINPSDLGLSYGMFSRGKIGVTNTILVRNPVYSIAEQTPTTVEIRKYQQDALLKDLASGSIDYLDRYQSNNLDNYEKIIKAVPANTFDIIWQAEPYLIVIDFNGDISPQLRQAISQSVDWNQVNADFFGARLVNSNSIFRDSDINYAYNDPVNSEGFQIDAVLKKEGWQEKDNFFYKQNQSLSMEITTLNGQPILLSLQQILSNSLKKYGIQTVLNTVNQGVFYSEKLPKRDFKDIAIYIVPVNGDPFINWLRLVYAAGDQSVATLLDELPKNPSLQTQMAIWEQIQAHITNNPRFTPLFFTTSLTLHKKNWTAKHPSLDNIDTWVRQD